jgi:hypothetical protein
MALFMQNGEQIFELETYVYKNEDELQKILYSCPGIIYNIPELELNDVEVAIKVREYAVGSGSIDVLLITKTADIIVIETKLLKNPESTRKVVVQIIDYIKSLVVEDVETFLLKIGNCKTIEHSKDFEINDKFKSVLARNIEHGNINGIIIGDDIHPNLLPLVSSLQSAPHLSFHINIIKLETFKYNNNLIFSAKNIENTNEIERSVISITINKQNDIITTIESSAADEKNKGNKQVLNWEEYISNINEKYRNIIAKFRRDYVNLVGDTINMGNTGFSVGINIGTKRLPLQLIFDDHLYLISDTLRKNAHVSDELYNIYKKEIERLPDIYDKHLISNKVSVKFAELKENDFDIIFGATIKLAKLLKENDKNES